MTPKYPQLYEIVLAKAQLSLAEWLLLENTLEPMAFKKGEFLAKPEETPDAIYVVIEGIVRNYFTSNNGREYTKIFRGTGRLVGPYSELLAQTKTKYYIQATLDAKVLKFSYSHFKTLMQSSHAWERVGRVIAEENFLEKEKREYMLMHMDIEEKYNEFLKDFAPFQDEIPQYQVASYLGVSPEALNRFLKKNNK
ncbi:MAG: Crp/Fnr family transcriptional regulator [Bacteriovoracaceae bacterium]|nr:Crp/Fnr family transcriptional regulator [Bacteriovoracaceae bacterium]